MKSMIILLFATASVALAGFATLNLDATQSPSCSCKQVKKEGCRQNACTYTFDCTLDDGTVKKVTVASSNDNQAKQLAELECD